MIPMKGLNDFNGRYDFFKWSAPIYETPEEVVRFMTDLRLGHKVVKSVSVIGAVDEIGGRERNNIYETLSRLGYTLEELSENGYDRMDKVLLPRKATIFEPVQIIFEDGDTLDFLPMQHGGARIAMNTIPAGLTYGMNRSNFDAHRLFGKPLKGAKIQNFSMETVETSTRNYSRRNVNDTRLKRPDIHTAKTYIFEFSNGYRLHIKAEFGNYVLKLFQSYREEALIGYPRLKEIEKTVLQVEIETTDNHMAFVPFNNKKEKELCSHPRHRYSNWHFYTDDYKVSDFLIEILYRYYDESLQTNPDYYRWENEGFDWYGSNLYTYESVRKMITDIRRTAELFEADPCDAALADIKKRFSVYDFNGGDYDQNYSAEEKVSIINENIHVAVDFYRRFAERLETLLRENADCDMICISGP